VEGRSRRRLSGIVMCALVAVVAAAAVSVAGASVGPAQQQGIFALLGGTQKITSVFWAEHKSGLTSTLNVRQFTMSANQPILQYDVDMQKLMHLIVVRDDFATFAHVHPTFDAKTGTFSVTFTKGPNHRYYVYADSTPHGIGQQVFRFVMQNDGPLAMSKVSMRPSTPYAHAGPYETILPKTIVIANKPQLVYLTIVKDDDPADDLVPYLGTAAHVVFINTSTLQYIHVHPMLKGQKVSGTMQSMEMGSAGKAGPFLQMMLPPLPPGVYKTWVQFAGAPKATVYTTAYTIVAQ